MRQPLHRASLMAVFALLVMLFPTAGAARVPAPAVVANCVYLPLVRVSNRSAIVAGLSGPAPTAGCPPVAVPAPTPAPPAEVSGALRLQPAYAQHDGALRVARYLVVFDASGSMSANFNGQCDNKPYSHPPPIQCANGPPGYPAVEVTGTGPNYYWKTESERRIYVAKKAIERLVGRLNLPGNPGYAAARPDEVMAAVWFNDGAPATNAQPFSNDPATLINFITDANNAYGAYRSEGGTNGAAGLYRAAPLLQAAPPTVDFNGQTYSYENHVIFVTDGVSNQFLDVTAADLYGGQSNFSTYPLGSYCRSLGVLVAESAVCQLTDPAQSPKFHGWDRPITQMINVSQDYLKSQLYGPTDVSVVALSNVPTTGLRDGVASSVNHFFFAPSLEIYPDGTNNIDAIIDALYARTSAPAATCAPVVAAGWVDQIDAAHLPDGAAGLGEVTLTSLGDGSAYSAPIARDPTTGQISYRFVDLPAGDYQLRAGLFYKGDDGVTRIYNLIDTAGGPADRLTVSLSGQSQSLDPVGLQLAGDVCSAP